VLPLFPSSIPTEVQWAERSKMRWGNGKRSDALWDIYIVKRLTVDRWAFIWVKPPNGGQNISSLETKGQSKDIFIATMTVQLLLAFKFSLIDVPNESLYVKYVHLRLPCCNVLVLVHSVTSRQHNSKKSSPPPQKTNKLKMPMNRCQL